MAVDAVDGLMSHIQSDLADRRNSVLLLSIVDPLSIRLAAHELLVREVAANTNYSNPIYYSLLEARSITPEYPFLAGTSPN